MMERYIPFLIFMLVCLSCNHTEKPVSEAAVVSQNVVTDSMEVNTERVLSFDITKIIPGSEQIRKAYSFFTINGNDTSAFRCHFSEWKADSTLFFVAKFSKDISYRQQQHELVKILDAAAHDFDLKALNTVGFGRLITTGDLAIRITQQYKAIAYKEELNAFLLHSALGDEMNALLNPYGIKVKKVITEKQEYLPHQQLSKYSVIETPAKDIPDEIVDCVVYLKLERI